MNTLKPCPFCGHPLFEVRRRYNPYAHCQTPDCMGGKLPLISLDIPEDIERWNRRALPEGMALVPRAITAESGHKSALMGEFSEVVELVCPECHDLDEEDEDCEICGGAGHYSHRVYVEWSTIKDIHRRMVEITEARA